MEVVTPILVTLARPPWNGEPGASERLAEGEYCVAFRWGLRGGRRASGRCKTEDRMREKPARASDAGVGLSGGKGSEWEVWVLRDAPAWAQETAVPGGGGCDALGCHLCRWEP